MQVYVVLIKTGNEFDVSECCESSEDAQTLCAFYRKVCVKGVEVKIIERTLLTAKDMKYEQS